MDHVRALFHKPDPEQEYEPLDNDEVRRPVLILPDEGKTVEPYSRVEYYTFIMLGISQLWAWYESDYSMLCSNTTNTNTTTGTCS